MLEVRFSEMGFEETQEENKISGHIKFTFTAPEAKKLALDPDSLGVKNISVVERALEKELSEALAKSRKKELLGS